MAQMDGWKSWMKVIPDWIKIKDESGLE